ncbi:hypothetical protein E2562_033378 [Oryza meyeriana var. granulata]|uniref:RRM domain-containing protein n=1 Tax=Oryza meyeriana var. granulata TaxID=110450 RepID=A0A6G1C1B2_9ORYZ|nr:hypothetical protein E2562_033378 [Oryza meyeriana var. granulata]
MADISKTKKVKSSKEQRALKGSVNKLPVGHTSYPMSMDHMVDMVLPHLELDKNEFSMVPKNFQAVTEQPRVPAPLVVKGFRWGMASMTLLPFRRVPADGKLCYICGEEDGHEELDCPFNYMDMPDFSHTCKRRCPAGKHPIVVSGSGRRREFLRCVVRVNNMPPKICRRHLGSLCKAFGPLRMYHLVMRNCGRFCRGFGYAIYWSRQHAERAIEGLNGRIIDGRKLRVDWAYPCI